MRTCIFICLICIINSLACSQNRPDKQLTDQEKRKLAEQHYATAVSYMQGSDSSQMYFDSALAVDPQFAKAWREKSVPFLKRGYFVKWADLMGRAVELEPREYLGVRGYCRLGFIRDYEGALADFEELSRIAPQQVHYPKGFSLYCLKGLALKQLGRYEEAIRNFSIHIDEEADAYEEAWLDELYLVYRGICYAKLGQSEQAFRDFDDAIKRNNRCAEAYFQKARLLIHNGKQTEACPLLALAADLVGHYAFRTDPYRELFDQVNLEEILALQQPCCLSADP